MAKVSVISPSFIEGFVTVCHNRGLMEKEAASLLNGYIDGAMHLSEQNMEKKAAPMPFAKLFAENLKYGGHLFNKLFPKKFIKDIPNIATRPLRWGGELANKHGWPGGVVGVLGATAAYGLPVYAFDKYRQSDAPGSSTLRALTGSGSIFGGNDTTYGMHSIPGAGGDISAPVGGATGSPEVVPTSRDNIFTGPGKGEERDLPSLGVSVPALSRSGSVDNGGVTGSSFLGSDSEARAFGDLLNEREGINLEIKRTREDANRITDSDLRALDEKRISSLVERQNDINNKIRNAASTQGTRLAKLRSENAQAIADNAASEARARQALRDNLGLYNRLHGGGFVARALGDVLDSDSMFTNANSRGDELSEIIRKGQQLKEEEARLRSYKPISVGF